MSVVDPEDYRVEGERKNLLISMGILVFVFFILLSLSIGLALIIVGIAVALLKVRQGQLLGNCVKVSQDVLPEVHDAAKTAAQRLSMRIPDVFVGQNPVINAYALGFWGRKSVILNSKTVECMEREELISILGHEFSHIRCHHTDWMVIAGSATGMSIPIISDILSVIFMTWTRKSEFTADRGGLLASRDLNSSAQALLKVAVGDRLYKDLDLDKFLRQDKEIDADIIAKIGQLLVGHPYIVKRLIALHAYRQSEQYERFVADGVSSGVSDGEALKRQIDRLKEEIEKLKRSAQQGEDVN